VQTTGFAPVQTPDWQVSVWVQAFSSLHGDPFVFGGSVQMPVPVSHTPASWHWSRAVQTTGFVPVQTPASQVSVWVQAFPSLHGDPFVFGGPAEQSPVPVSQVPGSWQVSGAVQTTGLEPMQTPDWQVSVWVQAFPSLQAVPLGLTGGAEQIPVEGLQVPGSWQVSGAVQTTGFDPVQTPDWQVSVWVHAFPSLQTVPLETGGCWQPESPPQTSWVQALVSVQRALPPSSIPLTQLSSNPLQTSAAPG
jgi:hypothetical protein